jgi:hypothetical protein
MWLTKKNKSLDKITSEFSIDVSKAYKNVSKHKRVLSPVINWNITLYVNEIRLNDVFDNLILSHFRGL